MKRAFLLCVMLAAAPLPGKLPITVESGGAGRGV